MNGNDMDLTECLAAIRRFKNIPAEDVGNIVGKAGTSVNRWELKSIGFDLEQAQSYANAIGAKVTVRVEFDGFTREVPLFYNASKG